MGIGTNSPDRDENPENLRARRPTTTRNLELPRVPKKIFTRTYNKSLQKRSVVVV